MGRGEDIVAQDYPYAWHEGSDLSIQEFLTKYKPSMVQDDGSKPWIWVKGSSPSSVDKNTEAAVEEATALLKEVTEKVENIKNDDSIPTRSNKKTGAKSKKEVREQVQAEATEKLKDISVRHGFISGKWLIFAQREKVDMIWSSLATSLISGPLSTTSAFEAKVATCPKSESANSQHTLCLYMPNVYDQDAITEMMKILLKNHGMTLSGVKSNLYTAIGLDSKHASGIPSTVWKNAALMKDAEMKELKDEYFANIGTEKAKNADKTNSKDDATSSKQKKPVPKKKAREADPFASDDEEDKKQMLTKVNTGAKRPKESEGEDEDDGRPMKKKS
ncbi:hypothetical protein PILCRDRAFT_821498 [Piloderma croceum F 1598]|uniref:Uncharacterized protein n=1 Tax=Piloderma croceum (strain F 1598) TaxID=765440 RepID=A0A0C3FNS5_PILCF|nr:hypothetical protein PILCRDRAFT_821498 [Piloderma croceum F 1598]